MPPRISITARLVADLIQTAGATHVNDDDAALPTGTWFSSATSRPLPAARSSIVFPRTRPVEHGGGRLRYGPCHCGALSQKGWDAGGSRRQGTHIDTEVQTVGGGEAIQVTAGDHFDDEMPPAFIADQQCSDEQGVQEIWVADAWRFCTRRWSGWWPSRKSLRS